MSVSRFAALLAGLAVSLVALQNAESATTSYTPGAPGDADCSGAVSSADVLVVLRVLAGLEATDPNCDGDSDGDGLDIDDARVIRRWVAGLPVRPNLVAVLPGSVPAGAKATTFTLRGGFIAPNTVIVWNGTPYAVTLADSGSIATVTIPAGEFAAEGSQSVSLQTPGEPLSAAFAFEVTAPGTCSMPVASSGTLVVDKDDEFATFTLNAPQDMTGWTLVSLLGPQTFEFPDGYSYNPALGRVTVVSGQAGTEDAPTRLHWTGQHVWNNTEPDPGELRDCSGTLVAQWLDPPTP